MITLAISSLMSYPLILIKTSPNPVKMSMSLLMSSILVFTLAYMMTSLTWYPMIYFLIFMGGILMMFMILSSVLPNEKSKKAKNLLLAIMMMLILSWVGWVWINPLGGFSSMIKSTMNSSQNLGLMVFLMILYFFLALLMVSKQENPLRTQMC